MAPCADVVHTIGVMGAPRKPKIREKDLHGFKHFKLLLPMLSRLHDHRCARDRAGNRQLHFDQYLSLILLYFFNPIISSLRGIQQAGELQKVQRLLGCPRAALGSLSEAARIFDADLLRGMIGELAEQLSPINPNPVFDDLKGVITLVDSSFLRALPGMTEAMWRQQSSHAGFRLHAHFELLKGVPTRIDLTNARTTDQTVLLRALQPDRLYVVDRGYIGFELFDQIITIGSSLVCRLREHMVYEVVELRYERDAPAADGEVIYDAVVRFNGSAARQQKFERVLRVVQVKCKPHRRASGKTGRGGPEQGERIILLTDMLDVPAHVIAQLYQHRWAIETFFRFFKHVLGCRHLLSHCHNGVEIQTYVAIIACLLIALWTGKKPTLRTYEMICFYFSGMATLDELLLHIEKLKSQAA